MAEWTPRSQRILELTTEIAALTKRVQPIWEFGPELFREALSQSLACQVRMMRMVGALLATSIPNHPAYILAADEWIDWAEDQVRTLREVTRD